MRPYFAECTKPVVAIANWGVLYNHPVNLALCQSMTKKTLREEGWPSVPALRFEGCETTWKFETEAARDAEMKRLIDESKEAE